MIRAARWCALVVLLPLPYETGAFVLVVQFPFQYEFVESQIDHTPYIFSNPLFCAKTQEGLPDHCPAALHCFHQHITVNAMWLPSQASCRTCGCCI